MRLTVVTAFLALTLATPGWAAPALTAPLKDAKGHTIGTVSLTDSPNGVLVRVEAQNLPQGWHGMHLHDKGSCEMPKFESAGGHVHMGAGAPKHGFLNADQSDSGDLPNLHVGADGSATVELYTDKVRLHNTAGSAPALLDSDGSSLIIHTNPDDYTSQPIGGSGARIACAVLK